MVDSPMKGIHDRWSFRSTVPMKYDPRVLVTGWQEAREQYPLDYDYSKPENLDLHRSSYRNFWFGDPNAPLPKSTTHEMMDEALDWHGRKKVIRHPYLDNLRRHSGVPIHSGVRQVFPRGVVPRMTVIGRPFVDYEEPVDYGKTTSTAATQTPDSYLRMDRELMSPYDRDTYSYNYIGYPKWHTQDYVLYPCYEPWSAQHRTDPVLKSRKPERFLL